LLAPHFDAIRRQRSILSGVDRFLIASGSIGQGEETGVFYTSLGGLVDAGDTRSRWLRVPDTRFFEIVADGSGEALHHS
jgi:hypothetical protein